MVRVVGRSFGRPLGGALLVLVVFLAFLSYGRAVDGPGFRASLAAETGTPSADGTGTGDTVDGGGSSPDGGSVAEGGSGADGTAEAPSPATPEKLAVVGTVLDAVASILPAAPSMGQVAGGNVIAVLRLLPPEVFDPVLQAYTSLLDAISTGALSAADMAKQLNAALSPLAAYVNPVAGAIGAPAIDGAGAVLRGGEDAAALLGHHLSYLSWLADNLAVYKDTFNLT